MCRMLVKLHKLGKKKYKDVFHLLQVIFNRCPILAAKFENDKCFSRLSVGFDLCSVYERKNRLYISTVRNLTLYLHDIVFRIKRFNVCVFYACHITPHLFYKENDVLRLKLSSSCLFFSLD